MTGLAVRCDVAAALREAQRAFEELGASRFPRAVQYALTGVAIDGVNRWRWASDTVFDHPTKATREGVRYTVDKDLLGKVTTVGEAKASVFIMDMQSAWLKYSFGSGENVRHGGDVGVEAYFSDQNTVKVPNASGIARTGLGKVGPGGKVPAADARTIARLAVAGYTRNTGGPGTTRGSARSGAFEVKAGDAALGKGFIDAPGIWARPPRVVASVGRKRVARAVKAGRREAPTTTFTRANGTSVTVPRVVNNDVPRMLYLSTDEAHYEPVATPSWERCMEEAAATMADKLAAELTGRLERMVSKGRRR